MRGLIDEVVAPEILPARAAELAERFAAIPPESFRLTKQQLRHGTNVDDEAREIWSLPEIHAHIREYLARTLSKKS